MVDKFDLSTKAQSLRKKLGEESTGPIDIFSIAHTIPKLTIVFYPMGENISGLCIKNEGNPVIAVNSTMSLGRQRFSMAHEFFHLFFDDSAYSMVCTKKIGFGDEVEKAADQFASYFLIPPIALSEELNKIYSTGTAKIGLNEIVKLEQYFQVSRQAIIFRLIDDKVITPQEAEPLKQGIIRTAINLGYDDKLYKPLPENQQYRTFGYYIQKADELYVKDVISTGKYEELLLNAFRSDIVYGNEDGELELND